MHSIFFGSLNDSKDAHVHWRTGNIISISKLSCLLVAVIVSFSDFRMSVDNNWARIINESLNTPSSLEPCFCDYGNTLR